MINRPEYLADLVRFKDKDDLIKIVTGVRRCGKSTLFLLFQDYLLRNGVFKEQILHINLELAENSSLLAWQNLHKHVESHIEANKMNYVFLDEIQIVKDFPKAINSLRLKKNVDLYVTGSNAYMFSSSISTLLSGRFIEIKMLPLSFREYMYVFEGTPNITLEAKFNDYLIYGSFPQVLDFLMFSQTSEIKELDKKAWHSYLDSLYNTIIVKDIMSRRGIPDFSKLERIIRFMFGNIGSQTSINNISNVINNDLKSHPNEKKIHAQTIEKYIDSLTDGYVFYKTTSYYLKGKERLRSNAKYYAVDTGLRYFLLGGALQNDTGHILENVVYLELKRRGYKVEIGKIGDLEIDFVAQLPGGKIEYYQVAQSVISEDTLKRELTPLLSIKDSYPKYLLTRDYSNNIYKGIQHINIINWLLGKE
ncbi:MAG: ATP-binding protein [Endomicrobium sp.]|jgi:predicted AAA+ superfamily ATPase|nr:ATP-binding protein [Endomicrobium sp.]